MRTYTLLSGESLSYEATPELAAFIDEIERVAADPATTEDQLVAIVYSDRNPLLDTTTIPGRASVTRATYADPAYHVMLDLLARAREREHKVDHSATRARFTLTVQAAAAQLGITEQAVRKAIQANRLSAYKDGGTYWIDPASVASYRVSRRGQSAANPLDVRLGSAEGISFQVKHPGELADRSKAGSVVTGRVESWRRVAVLIGEGEEARYLELAPSNDENEVKARGFHVRGRFRVVEQNRNPRQARTAFKAFEAE